MLNTIAFIAAGLWVFWVTRSLLRIRRWAGAINGVLCQEPTTTRVSVFRNTAPDNGRRPADRA